MRRTKVSILYSSDKWSCFLYLGENVGAWFLSTLSLKYLVSTNKYSLLHVSLQILSIGCTCREYLMFYLDVDFCHKIIPIIISFQYTSLFHFREDNIINSNFPDNLIILPLIVIPSLLMGEYNERLFLQYTGYFQTWFHGNTFGFVLF